MAASVYLSPVEDSNTRIVTLNVCYKWDTFAMENTHLFYEIFCIEILEKTDWYVLISFCEVSTALYQICFEMSQLF